VARNFGLGRNQRFLVGMEAEYRGLVDGIDPGYLHCFLHSGLAPGYIGWIAPAPAVTQLGLATQRHARPSLGDLHRHVAPLAQFSPENIVERRSGLIPCGGLVHPFAAPGVLLIGDAAGCTSPLTAGGIQLAFRLGRRAGQLIADHLTRGGLEPATVIARQLPRFAAKLWLRRVLETAPPDFVWNALIATATLREMAHRLYFHARAAPSEAQAVSPPAPQPKSPGREPARQARRQARN
jgi:flavin-dependent dehydrogenase